MRQRNSAARRPLPCVTIAAVLALASMAGTTVPAAAKDKPDNAAEKPEAKPKVVPSEEALDCLAQLTVGDAKDIVCEVPLRMGEKEIADLKRVTRDVLQEAQCTLTVRIQRQLVSDAVVKADHVFEAPPQPVVCEVKTAKKVYPVKFSFAPRVVIKDGVAIEASPGMADVSGVPSVLSWPVLQYVNRSGTVRDGMLQVINAYRKRFGASKK